MNIKGGMGAVEDNDLQGRPGVKEGTESYGRFSPPRSNVAFDVQCRK